MRCRLGCILIRDRRHVQNDAGCLRLCLGELAGNVAADICPFALAVLLRVLVAQLGDIAGTDQPQALQIRVVRCNDLQRGAALGGELGCGCRSLQLIVGPPVEAFCRLAECRAVFEDEHHTRLGLGVDSGKRNFEGDGHDESYALMQQLTGRAVENGGSVRVLLAGVMTGGDLRARNGRQVTNCFAITLYVAELLVEIAICASARHDGRNSAMLIWEPISRRRGTRVASAAGTGKA